jgi:hypothetical protein
MQSVNILAKYKDENRNDYTTENVKGYTFINTAGHGYLCLCSTDNGYSDAIEIARKSNFSYILEGGLVYLEKDCDANEFLSKNLTN